VSVPSRVAISLLPLLLSPQLPPLWRWHDHTYDHPTLSPTWRRWSWRRTAGTPRQKRLTLDVDNVDEVELAHGMERDSNCIGGQPREEERYVKGLLKNRPYPQPTETEVLTGFGNRPLRVGNRRWGKVNKLVGRTERRPLSYSLYFSLPPYPPHRSLK
jgi:hypothetical protein